MERWEGENFRAVFRHILQSPSESTLTEDATSAWRSHDAFDLGSKGERIAAETSLYDGAGQCSVMRNWQGWLALSETRAAEGTLKVLPFLKESTAYIMLRPFFTPRNKDASSEGFLDASNWSVSRDLLTSAQERSFLTAREYRSLMRAHPISPAAR